MNEPMPATVSSKVAYEIALHTVAAQQLWSGRRAEKGSTFIPGIINFHHSVTALENEKNDVERLRQIDVSIRAARQALSEWQRRSDSFIHRALPNNTRPATAPVEPRSETLRFGDARSRQVAMLIARFDEACKAALIAASVAHDVDGPAAPMAQAEIRQHAKLIRRLFYLSRQHHAGTHCPQQRL